MFIEVLKFYETSPTLKTFWLRAWTVTIESIILSTIWNHKHTEADPKNTMLKKEYI